MNDNCVKYLPCIIKVTSISGNCRVHKNEGDEYNLEDFNPKGLCLLAFHSIYPYVLTLFQGGYFGWFKDRGFIIAQCPNPNIAISLEIKKISDSKEVAVKVIQAKGKCPQKMKIGDKFIINIAKSQNLCYRALNSILPFLNIKRYDKNISNQNIKDLFLHCPSYPNNVKFKITFNQITDEKDSKI